ncbi:MAG: ribose 5-phosphate isomerase B [Oscillospiraceae bacterium]|nr:ribose 5-phosphate isomerase B [Oscillospiraceae bacterium]
MIALAADHAGFSLKEEIKQHLIGRGFEVKDFGTDSEQSVDYALFARDAGEAVASGECELGIFCCGTGVGISMAANKVRGIRAANCSDTFSARMTRLHNNANVLCLGSRVIGAGLALDMVDLFVDTEFSGEERHQRRIDQVMDIENKKFAD